jgi:hypothetical protein
MTTATFTQCQMCGRPEIYREDVCKTCDARLLGIYMARTQAAHEILTAAIKAAIEMCHMHPDDVRVLAEKVIADTRPYGLTETWLGMHRRFHGEHADEDMTT